MRVPSLFTALLLSAGLWAQLPFSFSGSAGGDCAPQIHNEPWPGGVSPTDLTGSVRFDWSATNATSDPVLMEVRVYRDEYPTTPGNGVQENLEFSFTFTAAPNGTSSGAAFWTCPISSFEELRAHSVRVSGPSGTCTAFSMTVGYVVPAFGNDAEPNEDPGSQPLSTVNIDYNGHLRTNNATDDDWYRIQLPAQGKLLITLQSETPGSTPGTIEAQLIYTTSTLINTWSGPTGTDNVPNTNVFEQTCAGNANGGIYYLRIRASGACDVSYRMTLTLVAPAFTNDTEPNNSTGDAIILPETQIAQGQLYFQHGDNVDIYRTDLSSDGVMHIAMEAEQAGTSTTGTLQVILFTSNSTVLETWNVPVGANSVPISTALSKTCRGNTSPYYLQLIASDCGTSYRFSYSVTPPLFAQDPEPNNSTSQAVPLPATQTADGHLNFYFGDNLDIYRLNLTTDGVLHVAFEAEHADASTTETIQIYLSNSVGTILKTWTAPVGANSIAVSSIHDMTCLGTVIPYYLSVASSACGASYHMSYTMTPPLFANDVEPNGSTGQAIVLPPSTQTTGRLNFNAGENLDYYRINLPTDGVLNVTIEAEHAGLSTIETVAAYISLSTGTTLATWNAAVGAGSSPTSNSFSLSCRGTNNPYYLILASNVCGVSYRVSWTVTPPVYANDPEPNNSTPGTPMDLNAGEQQGHIGFYNLGDADYYAFTHPGGPWSVTVSAEHANAGEGTLNMMVINNPGTLFGTFTVPVGGSSAPLTNTFTIPSLPAGSIYRLVFTEATCGVSYRIHCYDDDNDGTCNAYDLCAGGPEPGTPCDDGTACTTGDVIDANCTCIGTPVLVDDGDPCTLDSCDPINGVSHVFQDSDGDGTCDANDLCPGGPEPGTACNDGYPNTSGDVIQSNCSCAGILACTPGAPCNDFNACTTGEVFQSDCQCAGGTAVDPDDGDPCTLDSCDPITGVSHVFQDSDGDGTCDANDLCPGGLEPGTACNDGDPNTSGDVIQSDCSCAGVLACIPGAPCNDFNACTTGEVFQSDCTCAGGTAVNADDGDPCTLDSCDPITGVSNLFQDSDGDLTCDVNDGCPNDYNKIAPGACGCGVPDEDSDADTIADCIDTCPLAVDGIANFNVAECNCDPGYTAQTTQMGSNTVITSCVSNGGCNNDMVLEFQTDGAPGETTWEVLDATGTNVVANGGPLTSSNTVQLQNFCLPDGCYRLRVLDNAGDGMSGGGYTLKTLVGNQRVIDNRNNFASGGVSTISGGGEFCLPLGTDRMIHAHCDKLDWVNYKYLVATENTAVSAEWIPNASNYYQDANSGYEFWIFDPNGTYSYRRFRSHNVSDGKSPANATRACHMKINGWYNSALTPLIPQQVIMNVRVRGRVNGTNMAFGPACLFQLDQARAACPFNKLLSLPGDPRNSCGATKNFGSGNFVYATPFAGIPTVPASQLRYQFRFRNVPENFEVIRTSNTYILPLYWTGPTALQCGVEYTVDVRVSTNGGNTWCTDTPAPAAPFQAWGEICTLAIAPCASNIASASPVIGAYNYATLTLYPNPNNGDQLTIALSAVDDGVNTVSVDIFDLTGKRITARTVATQGGSVNAKLDLNNEVANGIYLTHITAGKKTWSERLVIQR